MIIINIVGKKSSGKSTVAKYLVAKYGFARLSFARHLKETAKFLFGFTEEQVNGDLKEVIDPRYGVCPRQVLQWLGTDVMQFSTCQHFPEFSKIIGRLFWVKKLVEDIDNAHKNGIGGVVIDDCRFIHEAKGVIDYVTTNNHFGSGHIELKTIRILRDSQEQASANYTQHPSETELDNITVDVKINNTTLTIEELYRAAEEAIVFN
jgi:hypothetical protein